MTDQATIATAVRPRLERHVRPWGGLLWCDGCRDMWLAPPGRDGTHASLVCRYCGRAQTVCYEAQLNLDIWT